MPFVHCPQKSQMPSWHMKPSTTYMCMCSSKNRGHGGYSSRTCHVINFVCAQNSLKLQRAADSTFVVEKHVGDMSQFAASTWRPAHAHTVSWAARPMSPSAQTTATARCMFSTHACLQESKCRCSSATGPHCRSTEQAPVQLAAVGIFKQGTRGCTHGTSNGCRLVSTTRHTG